MVTQDRPLLRLENVSAGYKDLTVIQRASLAVGANETVCVIGRNGMGKTTLLATVMGMTKLRHGQISFNGRDASRASTLDRARAGIGFVPQEREVFRNLTVEENLLVAWNRREWTTERSYALFPRLADRRNNLGSQLSGGEQQMLAIARALMGTPALLLLDEPSEGLAPVIVDEVFHGLDTLRRQRDLAIVVVEQHVKRALAFAPRVVAMRNGCLIYDGASAELLADATKLDALVGVSATAEKSQHKGNGQHEITK